MSKKRQLVSKKKQRMSKYWICQFCADKKKWKLPPNSVNTVIAGLCGWCKEDREIALIPVCDFIRNRRLPVWD